MLQLFWPDGSGVGFNSLKRFTFHSRAEIPIQPLTLRFIIAGVGFIAGGVAIAVIKEGVGEQAVLIGSVVAVLGVCLVVSGIRRHLQGPPN